jgi:Domain of unknown function (DUF4185)
MNPTISTWLAKPVGTTITREAIKMPDLVCGKTRKVVQLVGEIDRQRHGHPPQTFTKYGLYGTDLGTPLDFGPGRELWFLFGDAWSATVKPVSDHLKIPFLEPALYRDSEALRHPYNRDHPFNADPVGRAQADVTAKNLDGTFQLNFFAATRPGQSQEYATLEIPGVNLLTNQVPTGAISTPTGVYVFATGKPFHEGDDPARDVPQWSWVARWSDLTSLKTEPPYLFSDGRFANYLVPVVGGVNDGTRTNGHPGKGAVVWLWGTGFPNRQSSVRLAYAPLQEVGNRAAWRFFHRTNGTISWVTQELRATPLFNCPSVGEFSVAWNKYLGLWLMLYACSDPRGILCRWAADPWGPWAEGIVVFDPWRDNGYKHFMHFPNPNNLNEDGLSDPGREKDAGGEYAPIIIPRYTLGSSRTTKIRYTMSTWNPYTVVIMESELRLRREGIFAIVPQVFENALARVLGWIRR